MLIIPLTPETPQDIHLPLENEAVTLYIAWNATADSWTLDVSMDDGSNTAHGLRLSPGVNIIGGLGFSKLGGLFISDEQQTSAEPTFDGLGTQFKLWYLTRAEMDEYSDLL